MINFRQLFHSQQTNITSAAIIIGATSLASRLLGIIRDRILAGTFGAGAELDTYYAAFRLPDLMYNLLVLGALSAGFIPILVSYIKNYHDTSDNKEAWELVNNILNLLTIALVFLSALLLLLIPSLTNWIAPGFSLEQKDTTEKLTAIMLLSPLLLGISSIFSSILQSFKRFLLYSLAPIFYNLGIIFGALFLTPYWGITGLAWGVILGSAVHLLSQLIFSYNLGYRYQNFFNLKHSGVKQIMKMLAPRTLTLAVTQINLLVITTMASTLAAGSITVFNLANNLQSFSVGIFGVSFAIAAFPTLSSLANTKDHKDFIKNFSDIFRQISFFVIPISLLLIILRAQTVRIVLGSGQFDWTDTIMTMNTLTFFSFSLLSQALNPLLVRAFYAYKDSQTPFYMAIFSVIINIFLSIFFTKNILLGVSGLALAFSIASWFNTGLLIIALRSKLKLGKIDGITLLYSILKITLAAILAAITTQGYKFIIGPITGTETLISLLAQTTIAGGIGILVYGSVCWLFKIPEIFVFFDSLKARLLRFKKLPVVNISEGEDINVG